MQLADLTSCLQAQERLGKLYAEGQLSDPNSSDKRSKIWRQL